MTQQLLAPPAPFEHLRRMTDDYGTFEHADHTSPRKEHGYCTDDMARVLVVASRGARTNPVADDLAIKALHFVAEAQGIGGDCRNRRDSGGHWHGPYTVEDCWGRSLWGLGTAAARSPHAAVRQSALGNFNRGVQLRAPWPRTMALAGLGAAEVLREYPGHLGALRLLEDVAVVIGPPAVAPSWPWPEPRLSYANAVLPEAMLAAGVALGRQSLVDEALALLAWLLDHETRDGHLSPTPVGGCGPDDRGPGFDQQPIEVAALADACSRAAEVSANPRWVAGVSLAVAWFLGDNDAGAPMWDPESGGGYDGLRCDGANLNQGAESTICMISTFQHGPRSEAL